jgi:hypothetical protein
MPRALKFSRNVKFGKNRYCIGHILPISKQSRSERHRARVEMPSIPFVSLVELLSEYWHVESIPGASYHYTLEACADIGDDVYLTHQSGFLVKSIPNPPKKLLSVCELLEGEIWSQVGSRQYHFKAGDVPPLVVTNIVKDEDHFTTRHENLKMRFFQVSVDDTRVAWEDVRDLAGLMIYKYNLSFVQVYEAIKIYQGLGPLKPLPALGSSDRDNEIEKICILFSNFAKGAFALKEYAHQINTNISWTSKQRIAGKKVSDWATIYKIQLWKLNREKLDASELAHLLGYSSPVKMRDFLKRAGEI